MSTPYAGADTYPTDYLIPDDGDDEDATSINVALEALGDRTTYLKSHGPRLITQEFTTPGADTWICPERVTRVRVRGVGGGGGGGGGTAGAISANGGGSGGGGPPSVDDEIDVTPGVTYNLVIGAGGTGAAPTADGGDGGDSSFTGDTRTVTAIGGGGGGNAQALWNLGGPSVRNGQTPITQATLTGILPPLPGVGGSSYGTDIHAPAAYYRNGGGSGASLGGACGADFSSAGQFGGGGGGASGFSGNVPGVGGDGTGSGNGQDGTAGTLGAGGGGGGGGPSGNAGGSGGAGGDGAITLSWVEESP